MTTATRQGTAFDRVIEALERDGRTVKRNGPGQAQAQCPAHDDNNPSLSITDRDDRALVYCHAGCDTDRVLDALNLDPATCSTSRRSRARQRPPVARSTTIPMAASPAEAQTRSSDSQETRKAGVCTSVRPPPASRSVPSLSTATSASTSSRVRKMSRRSDFAARPPSATPRGSGQEPPGRPDATIRQEGHRRRRQGRARPQARRPGGRAPGRNRLPRRS